MKNELVNKLIYISNELRSIRDYTEEMWWNRRCDDKDGERIVMEMRALEDVIEELIKVDLKYKNPTTEDVYNKLKAYFNEECDETK